MKYHVHWNSQAEGMVEIEADSVNEALEIFNDIPYEDLFRDGKNGVIESDSDWEIWAEEIE